MKLAAEVKRIAKRGINKVFIDFSPTGEMLFENMQDAVRVEIEIDDAGTCLMYRYGEGGVFSGDTWHETLENAKKQAAFEYDIDEDDWIEKASV